MYSSTSSFETIRICATRLYEQERENPQGFSPLGLYVRRWVRWTEAGLGPPQEKPRRSGEFHGCGGDLSLVQRVNPHLYYRAVV
jgi:hypothetical protein